MIIAQQRSKLISLLVASVVVLGAIVFSWLSPQPITNAADISKFEAGNIMSDAVMSNRNSMTVQQIQTFLDSKNACNNTDIHKAAWYPTVSYSIKDGKFVCMAKESFNGESAAQIIWQAGQDYNINPQVLIVLLEKEQGLITDTWPNSRQYQTATGYGCPDTAPCDAQYYGLKNQLRQAANLFRTVLNGGWSNYPVGNVYIQYNPSASCGGSVVNIKNRATSALYRYTPYQPNEATKNVRIGVTAPCGAYGNKNFWWLFTDWFGSTINVGADAISLKYTSMGGKSSWLGEIKSDIQNLPTNGGLYQSFDNGNIYWTKNTGAWTVRNGDVSARYLQVGSEAGYLGYPMSDENAIRKDGAQIGVWQQFERGQMYWSASTRASDIRYGAMFNRYREIGFEGSYLGFPTSGEISTDFGVYQNFQGGRLYWRSGYPAMDMNTTFAQAYESMSYLGKITMSMQCGIKDNGCWQGFEKGKIYWSADSGSYSVYYGDMEKKFSELGYEGGRLGYPTSRETQTGSTCNDHKDVRQEFQGGTLYWSFCSNPSVRVEFSN